VKLVKKCPYCGRDIPDDAQFCPYCGRRLQAPALRAEVEILKQRIDRYKHEETTSLIMFAVFLVLAFITMLIGTLVITQLPPYSRAREEAMSYINITFIICLVAAIGFGILGGYCGYKRAQLQTQLEELLRSA